VALRVGRTTRIARYKRNLPAALGPRLRPQCATRATATARAAAVDVGAALPAAGGGAGGPLEAVGAVPARVDDPTERQAVRALTIALGAAGRDAAARQLAIAAGLAVAT
jgi:hypothetical protein